MHPFDVDSSSFAFRSHSALSTADIAIAQIPLRPRLRTAFAISCQRTLIAIASCVTSNGNSVS
jgi:hypothetical protein